MELRQVTFGPVFYFSLVFCL